MNHIEFLLIIRRFRLPLLAFLVLSIFAGIYILRPYVLVYRSTATFYIANEALVNPALLGKHFDSDPVISSVEQKKIDQLVYSTDMMRFLIRTFDLYNYYGIDTTSYFYFERTIKKISSRISVDKYTKDFLGVTFRDKNNEVAAAIANAIVNRLNYLNQKYMRNKLRSNLNLYNSFLRESAKLNNEQVSRLQGLLQNISEMNNSRSVVGANSVSLKEAEYAVYDAVARISELSVQSLNSQVFLLNSLSLMENGNVPTIVPVKRALPEISSKRNLLIIYSVGFGIVCLIAALVILYFIFTYKSEILLLFGKAAVDENKFN